MEQQHDRCICGSRFAVEDVDPVDLGGAVVDDRNGGLLRCALRGRVVGIAAC
jgi:hypothetical protein